MKLSNDLLYPLALVVAVVGSVNAFVVPQGGGVQQELRVLSADESSRRKNDMNLHGWLPRFGRGRGETIEKTEEEVELKVEEKEQVTAAAAVGQQPSSYLSTLEKTQVADASESSSTETSSSSVSTTTDATAVEKKEEDEEEMSETKKLMKQVKDAGLAGVISYALWEFGFWTLSVPVCVFGYYQVTGHMPDLSDPEDQKKIGAEAFAFVNFARFAVPLRIGLALGTTPWIDENIVRRFIKKDNGGNDAEATKEE